MAAVALLAGCRPMSHEEILQETRNQIAVRTARQKRSAGFVALQHLLTGSFRQGGGLREVAIVLEDSTLEEHHEDERGRTIYQGTRDVVDFWITLTPAADVSFDKDAIEEIVRQRFRMHALEVQSFWTTQSGDVWAVSGYALEPPRNPTAAVLRTCPNGHSRLRDVPIAYGLVIPDEDFRRRKANREIVQGGCCIRPEKHIILCLECDYRYDIGGHYWTLTSDRPSAFSRKLPPLILNVPLPSDAKPTYEQRIRAGRVGMTLVWFYSTETPKSLAASLKAYLASQGLRTREESFASAPEKQHTVTLVADCKGQQVTVTINEHATAKTTSVNFELGDENFGLATVTLRTLLQLE